MSEEKRSVVARQINIDIAKNGYLVELSYNYDSDKPSERYVATTIEEVAITVTKILNEVKNGSESSTT